MKILRCYCGIGGVFLMTSYLEKKPPNQNLKNIIFKKPLF